MSISVKYFYYKIKKIFLFCIHYTIRLYIKYPVLWENQHEK